MPQTRPALVWFRQDLRLGDNPALRAAAASGAPIFALYVHDGEAPGQWQPGAASRWWLRRSLASLDDLLAGQLWLVRGDAAVIVPRLAHELDASGVYWNRCVEPWRVSQDDEVKNALLSSGVSVQTFNGSYLFDPSVIAKQDGTPYRVFTPYFRKGCLERGRPPRAPLPVPAPIRASTAQPDGGVSVDELLPSASPFSFETQNWQPGAAAARQQLERFLDDSLDHYDAGRDRPDLGHVSRLSPHLHFGELSPQQVWHAVLNRIGSDALAANRFIGELGWREFSAYLLFHEPQSAESNLQKKFDRFPWRDDERLLRAWQDGMTGIPLVDAGMRELLQTGYMHNRVRMVAASFLVKNLMQHWRHGAAWFWEKLLDADLANNSMGWQWAAGSGADAAPFFRIFNPVTQGRKFDPDGDYVRRYVAELGQLPARHIHEPWSAPDDVLAAAGVRLGVDYPEPVVDLKDSRARALDAYRSLGATPSS